MLLTNREGPNQPVHQQSGKDIPCLSIHATVLTRKVLNKFAADNILFFFFFFKEKKVTFT